MAPVDPESPHNFAYHSHYFVMDNLIYNAIAGQQIMGNKVLPNLDITDKDYSTAEKNTLRGAQYSDVLDWMTRYQLRQPR